MMEENRNNVWNAEDENQLQLVDIWHMVWDYKWWYVLCVFVCLCVAAFKIYQSPKYFERSAKVIVDDGAQEAAMRDLSSFTGSMSRFRYSTNVDNEVEAIASPDLMQTVVERLNLGTSYYEHQLFRKVELGKNTPVEMNLAGGNPMSSFSFLLSKNSENSFTLSEFKVGPDELKVESVKGCLGDTLSTPVGNIVLSRVISDKPWNGNDITVSWRNSRSAAKSFSRNMNVAISGKQTSVVVLTIKDKFPTRAEQILNTLIDVYDESWVRNKNRSARNTSSFITDRLIVIEQELGEIESDLKNYKERNNLTDVKAISNDYLQQSSEYARKYFDVKNQQQIASFIKDYLNDPANSMSLIPSNSGLSNTNVESQIAKYNELMLERDNLLTTTSETNPLVLDLNNSLRSLKAAIQRSIDNLIATLNLQASQIEAQEEVVMKKMASSTGQEFELLSIERQQKVKESLYIYLLQKREENEIASLVNVGNTRLIMAPTGGPSPVEPRSMMILLVAIILGCGIPFGVIFLRKMFDYTVATKKDLTNVVTMPFLAEIPEVVTSKKKKNRFLPQIAKDDSVRRIVVKAGKRNIANESFRVLRTNVDMMLAATKGTKTVMLTSFYPGSGKTFITMNLAAGMAIKGSKTVLVDLDMRKSALSDSLGVNHHGLSEVLNGKMALDEVVENVSENLDVVKVGKMPPNPTELILSENFAALMAEMKSRYDYIFLDCPPVEIVADSAIITKYVDLTVFIVRAGLMDKRNLPVIEDIYKTGKYTRMAVVLNGVDAVSKKYGHYGSYGYGYTGYGYGYGYADKDD